MKIKTDIKGRKKCAIMTAAHLVTAFFVIMFPVTVFLAGCRKSPGEEEPVLQTEETQAQENPGGAAGPADGNPDYQMEYIEMDQEEKEAALGKLAGAMERCEVPDSVLLEEDIHRMVSSIAESGAAVICGSRDDNMRNYEEVESSLQKATRGEKAETEFYSVNIDGIFKYYRLQFEKDELFVTYASALYDENGELTVQQLEKIHAYQWEYTEKGWLIWEKALSRNQEMDMHIFYRILPLDEKCREMMKKCIEPVSYFGNNLFLEEWDENSMEKIELNDLFDSFYYMSTGEKSDAEHFKEGVPKSEFEKTIRQYLNIPVDEIEKQASYNEETGRYPWLAITAWNRLPQLQPFPEVVRCEKREDGVLDVYVEAVFVEEGTDCSFSHVVTLREEKDGSFIYLGNKVDWENAHKIPVYRARREF